MAPTPPPKGKGGFSKLPKWAQIALPVGGAVLLYYLYKKYEANAASSTTAATTPATDTTGATDGGVTGGGFPGGGGGGGGGLGNALSQLATAIAGLQPNGPGSDLISGGPPSSSASLPATAGGDNTSASTGTSAITQTAPTFVSQSSGGTTAQPGANEPTVTTSAGSTYSGISNQATAQSLINRGFTLYKNVGGNFVPANSPAGKASSNKGLYYNPSQQGVH